MRNDTLRHRDDKDDPLFRTWWLLTKAYERLSEARRHEAGRATRRRQSSEVRTAWHGDEVITRSL